MKLLFKGGKLDSRHVYDLTASTWTANRYFTDRKHPTDSHSISTKGMITPDFYCSLVFLFRYSRHSKHTSIQPDTCLRCSPFKFFKKKDTCTIPYIFYSSILGPTCS